MITDDEICCEYMSREIHYFRRRFLDEERNLLAHVGYDEPRRMFYMLNNRNPKNYGGIGIEYCPWCGKKLPIHLSPWAWLKYEYGKGYDWDLLPKKIQKEFDTDKWWKKRHLDDPKVLDEWCEKIPGLAIKLGDKMI